MATRSVTWIDTLASPSALTLNIFALNVGDGGSTSATDSSTVSEGNKHTWDLVGLATGEYRAAIMDGAVKVAEVPLYQHRDVAETVSIDKHAAIGAPEVVADATLIRNVSNVEATAGEHTLCTLVLAALEYAISGATLTIKRTNGTTTHATKTLTTDAGAELITEVT